MFPTARDTGAAASSIVLSPPARLTSHSLNTDTVDMSRPNPPVTSPNSNFTFVNLSEDLVSLCHRRISNRDQRHTIRSHVMQRVRQAESAQGKRRLTGREQSKRSGNSKARRKSNDSESPMSDESNGQILTSSIPAADGDRLSLTGGSPHQSPRLTLTPGLHQVDPFDTLPVNALPHQSSESLLQYCFDVLLPLTFSVETHQPRDRAARQGMVLRSKISNPATFLGFLATTAAHRAIMYGRHKDLAPSEHDHDDLILDPDYVRVKHEATIAVRQLFSMRANVDEQMLGACFGLIATNTVVGNFEEAKLHLQILDRMTSQIELSEETLMWLPISNVKVSVGLLQRPVMPLLLKREPIADEILRQISPPYDSGMFRLGQDLETLGQLSEPLRLLLSTHATLCKLCEFNATYTSGVSTLQMATLSKKSTELEFDLLAYVYENDAFPQVSREEPRLPPLEAIIRLAALGMLSVAPHTIMPAAGNGRALTHHQKKALETLVREPPMWQLETLRAVFWALFVFIQNSFQQPEEAFFIEILARVSRDLWLSAWEDVEKLLFGFLYIPKLQASRWAAIWKDVCRAREKLYPHTGSGSDLR